MSSITTDDHLTLCALIEAQRSDEPMAAAWSALVGPFDADNQMHRVLMLALAGLERYLPDDILQSLRAGALS